jgi:hypothetical protein
VGKTKLEALFGFMEEIKDHFQWDPKEPARYCGLTDDESRWLEAAFQGGLDFHEAHRVVALLCRRLANCRERRNYDTSRTA